MICSRKNSKSSSQLPRLDSAAANFSCSMVSAWSSGYASMTFAPSQRYTSSVSAGEMEARAWRVSLSSKFVSRSEEGLDFFSPSVSQSINQSIQLMGGLESTSDEKFPDRVRTSLRSFRNRTISDVFLISGIFSRRPWPRRWVFTSMNWYLEIISWKERRVGSTSAWEET